MKNLNIFKPALLVILLLTFIPCSILAYQFHNITENQGLSSRRAYSIAKDNKGFVWIANMVGIDKYDGENFYHYNFYQYNDYSKIAGVVADRKGNIYAFSENSLYRYNEDTDLCLQVLSGGWCTVLMNAFLIDKMATMQMKGGNTDVLYKGDGRLVMAKSLERMWPGVVKTERRFNRPQHVIKNAWKGFDTELIRRKDIDWDNLKTNNYGMKLKQVTETVKSEELQQWLKNQ